jgi:hypothetical protein
MHTRATTATLAVAGLLLAATACSSSSGDNKATSTPTSAAPATTTASTPPAPTPSPTPTANTVGQPWNWHSDQGATGATTVLGYKQPVLQDDPPGTSLGVPKGSQWGRLDIKVCEKAGPSIEVSQDPWHLQFQDGSQADTTGLFGGNFPKPEFPQDGVVRPGRCARGGILFPIPKGQYPVQVVYSPESATEPVYWDLPAK